MITPADIAGHELVGLHAHVQGSPCADVIGLNGTVIDETKSMVLLRTSGGVRHIPKAHTVFELTGRGASVSIEGSRILGRPHARLGAKR